MFCTKSARSALLTTAATVALATILGAAPLEARVTQIVIERAQSPAFDGASFGEAGQYEVIAGRAYGELDPNDERNTIITCPSSKSF